MTLPKAITINLIASSFCDAGRYLTTDCVFFCIRQLCCCINVNLKNYTLTWYSLHVGLPIKRLTSNLSSRFFQDIRSLKVQIDVLKWMTYIGSKFDINLLWQTNILKKYAEILLIVSLQCALKIKAINLSVCSRVMCEI
jgi:hypothetical protein